MKRRNKLLKLFVGKRSELPNVILQKQILSRLKLKFSHPSSLFKVWTPLLAADNIFLLFSFLERNVKCFQEFTRDYYGAISDKRRKRRKRRRKSFELPRFTLSRLSSGGEPIVAVLGLVGKKMVTRLRDVVRYTYMCVFRCKRLLRNYSDICVSQESSVDSSGTTPFSLRARCIPSRRARESEREEKKKGTAYRDETMSIRWNKISRREMIWESSIAEMRTEVFRAIPGWARTDGRWCKTATRVTWIERRIFEIFKFRNGVVTRISSYATDVFVLLFVFGTTSWYCFSLSFSHVSTIICIDNYNYSKVIPPSRQLVKNRRIERERERASERERERERDVQSIAHVTSIIDNNHKIS